MVETPVIKKRAAVCFLSSSADGRFTVLLVMSCESVFDKFEGIELRALEAISETEESWIEIACASVSRLGRSRSPQAFCA